MGDECNVLSHRMENIESFAHKDLKKSEKELPNKKHVRETPSGEPGEDKLQNPEVLHTENIPQVVIAEAISQEPEVGNFSYMRTKLRPDAPPFTLERVTPIGDISYREPDVEETRFVIVDLRPQIVQLIPEKEGLIASHSFKEPKDPALKPFSLTSTPLLNKHVPKVTVPAVEEEGAVISIPTNEPPTGEATAMPFPNQSRNFVMNFLLRNRIQIAVIMASLVICAILIVYVVV
ncbi:uncharacterized protein LOC117180379 [Belonocnema kinseyi]|uniref:uncharacterized protein LOC117180379 n=1 Tax=Belonocnema kinseyi TaxID=2817044 RepID=UPI00143D7F93|nr:uncharacterized protein LOC117180379 [Belonocnema kinseyi]XP_033228747.1 uncharacterized protein LOC117180379 [Belonocnema kinseyi]